MLVHFYAFGFDMLCGFLAVGADVFFDLLAKPIDGLPCVVKKAHGGRWSDVCGGWAEAGLKE